MASESIADEVEGRMGYWLKAHSGSRNNCEIFSFTISFWFGNPSLSKDIKPADYLITHSFGRIVFYGLREDGFKKNVTLHYHEAIFFVKFPLILIMKISLVIYQTISSNLQVPNHKNLFTSKQTSAAHFLSHEIKPFPHAFNSIAGSCFQLSLFLDHAFDEKVVVYTFRSLNTIFQTFYTGSGASFDFYQSSRLRTFCQKYIS